SAWGCGRRLMVPKRGSIPRPGYATHMNDSTGEDQMTSREVEEAVGLEGETLEAKAVRLRAQVEQQHAPVAELAEVERKIAVRKRATDEAQVRVAAKDRLLGIVRAAGSFVASAEQDDCRVL